MAEDINKDTLCTARILIEVLATDFESMEVAGATVHVITEGSMEILNIHIFKE